MHGSGRIKSSPGTRTVLVPVKPVRDPASPFPGAKASCSTARRSPGCWKWRCFAVAGPVALRAGDGLTDGGRLHHWCCEHHGSGCESKTGMAAGIRAP